MKVSIIAISAVLSAAGVLAVPVSGDMVSRGEAAEGLTRARDMPNQRREVASPDSGWPVHPWKREEDSPDGGWPYHSWKREEDSPDGGWPYHSWKREEDSPDGGWPYHSWKPRAEN